MNDREKLIKLVEDARDKDFENCNRHPVCKYCAYGDRASCHAALIADHLVANGVTVQNLDGCEYCHGLPRSERDCFTMPNASKRDYDIVTIKFCPMCGRKFPEPPKGELQCE